MSWLNYFSARKKRVRHPREHIMKKALGFRGFFLILDVAGLAGLLRATGY
jgi:hypothetical protein